MSKSKIGNFALSHKLIHHSSGRKTECLHELFFGEKDAFDGGLLAFVSFHVAVGMQGVILCSRTV